MRYSKDSFAVTARKILAARGITRTSRTREGVVIAHTAAGAPIRANHHGAIVVGETPERRAHLRAMAATTPAAHPFPHEEE